MSLFRLGEFTLASGQPSRWKIDCDGLTADDWQALAAMAVEVLPPFRCVHGVPRGGLPFAAALERYITARPSDPVLIAEDVVTTGRSMERYVAGLIHSWHPDAYERVGVCVFARGSVVPSWVTPLFQMPQRPEVR